MIVGHVRDHMPRVVLGIRGLNGTLQVEFIVDTGFDGDLAMPIELVNRLDASGIGEQIAVLAGKVVRYTDAFRVDVIWDGAPRRLEAMSVDGSPLLGGMALDGSLLQVEMRDGGEVTIEPL